MSFKDNMAYVIIDPALITQAMLNCMDASYGFSSVEDLTKNNDGTKVIITFNVNSSAPFTEFTWLKKAEILTELQKPEWLSVVD